MNPLRSMAKNRVYAVQGEPPTCPVHGEMRVYDASGWRCNAGRTVNGFVVRCDVRATSRGFVVEAEEWPSYEREESDDGSA